MMEQLLTILINGLLLIGIWWLYFIEYKGYRLDATRQALFRVRDSLFEEAACGKLGPEAFDSEAYGMMRTMLNGGIRFAHKISFWRIFGTIYADKRYRDRKASQEFDQRFENALRRLPYSGRKAILTARRDLHNVVIEHMVFSSFAFTVLFTLTVVLGLSGLFIKRLLTKPRMSSIDAEVESIGGEHMQSA